MQAHASWPVAYHGQVLAIFLMTTWLRAYYQFIADFSFNTYMCAINIIVNVPSLGHFFPAGMESVRKSSNLISANANLISDIVMAETSLSQI